MEKKNYNSMYKSKAIKETKEEIETAPVEELSETEAEPVVTEEKVIVHELPKPEPVKIDRKGVVIGNLNLNVRKSPSLLTGEISDALVPGVSVHIIDEQGEWYKISAPVEGFVMKKFIQ